MFTTDGYKRAQHGGAVTPGVPLAEQCSRFADAIQRGYLLFRLLRGAGPIGSGADRSVSLAMAAGLNSNAWDPARHPRLGTAPNPGWFTPTAGEGGPSRPPQIILVPRQGGIPSEPPPHLPTEPPPMVVSVRLAGPDSAETAERAV